MTAPPRPSVNHFSMDQEPKILIWNVRGLNARARRTAIRSLVVTTNASIACFQETEAFGNKNGNVIGSQRFRRCNELFLNLFGWPR